MRFVCVCGCGAWFDKRCETGKASKCAHCSTLKRGDIASIGRSGWSDRPTERGYWLTLTPPGADVLPWDTTKCHHSPDVPCAGDLGCVCEAHALALWHHNVGQRWSWFMTDLRRGLGVDVQAFKTWEPQHRGALHVHAMLRAPAGVSDRRFRAAVRLYSRRWGFGSQFKCDPVDLSDARQAARVAGYCAKYATKSADDLPDLLRLNPLTGELYEGGVRPWSSTRRWGDTMKAIKVRRALWMLGVRAQSAAADALHPGAGGALDLNSSSYADPVFPAIPNGSGAWAM